MEYKVTIVVEREDETLIERNYKYNKDTDYKQEVDDIINSLEKEF